MLPWFGALLFGLAFGKTFYPNAKKNIVVGVPEAAETVLIKPICFLGRHSLAAYLIHQPLLLSVLYAAHLI